jgi:uncharacterized protein
VIAEAPYPIKPMFRRVLSRVLRAALILTGVAAAGCGNHTPTTASSPAASWVDEQVSFTVGAVTVYGTLRHPAGLVHPVPAALLIAGSGPTDRDGNTPLLGKNVNTLQNLAQALSTDGVASLRYDKLGSGRTGPGPYAADPASIGIAPFQDEAAAALNFLAARPGVDRAHLMVIGHSEGALFALLLATAAAGTAPPVQALGLLEPLSRRYLDVISEQIHAQVAAAVNSKQISAAQADQLIAATDNAIQVLRSTGKVPPNVPPAIATVLNPTTALFLSQADAYDPAALAAKLPRGMPVLVSCSDSDVQVSCQDVDHLVAGLTTAGTATDYVHLTGVDHVLKQDPSKTAYNQQLPFSSQLTDALASFVRNYLAVP